MTEYVLKESDLALLRFLGFCGLGFDPILGVAMIVIGTVALTLFIRAAWSELGRSHQQNR